MTQKHQKCQKFEKYQKWGGCNNLPVTKHEWTSLNRPESVSILLNIPPPMSPILILIRHLEAIMM